MACLIASQDWIPVFQVWDRLLQKLGIICRYNLYMPDIDTLEERHNLLCGSLCLRFPFQFICFYNIFSFPSLFD